MVDVILLERIEHLGQMGDVVKVRPGYARNYLLPQKKAQRATKANLAAFEGRKAQLIADNLKRREEAAAVSEKMQGLKIIMQRQAGESGQLFGSVTGRDVAVKVTEVGFTITKNQVVIDHPIKTTGTHQVRVVLHPEVSVTVVLAVALTEDEGRAMLGISATAPAEQPAEDAAEA